MVLANLAINHEIELGDICICTEGIFVVPVLESSKKICTRKPIYSKNTRKP